MGFIKKITDLKDGVVDSFAERKNLKSLESKGQIVTDFRICNASREDLYVSGCISAAEKKIYFASQRKIEIGSILVDKFLNLYQISASILAKNKLFEEETITTICDFVPYIPSNPARNVIKQNANIDQAFANNTFSNIGTLILTVDQMASIEQTITVNQMAETVQDEMKYRYDPIKNTTSFILLINEILKGLKTIDELENKVVQGVLKEASSFLKDMIEMLIKNIRKKADDDGHYEE